MAHPVTTKHALNVCGSSVATSNKSTSSSSAPGSLNDLGNCMRGMSEETGKREREAGRRRKKKQTCMRKRQDEAIQDIIPTLLAPQAKDFGKGSITGFLDVRLRQHFFQLNGAISQTTT